MAPRALGALLALVAAIAFVVSVASSSWWSGHPNVEGQTLTAKDVRVGLLGATGCNTGGDGRCEDVQVSAGLKLVGLLELGAIGLATVLAFMLAVTAWSIGDRRRLIAHTMIVVALLALAGALVVLLVGPAIRASQRVDVPIGWGVYVFGAATLAALGAAAITRSLQPEPLRLKPSAGNPVPPPPDVREILREQHDGLRPAQLGPEPMLRSGPLPTTGSLRPSVPLIGGAPQLRPLYDPTNEGFVPAPASPPLPTAPPAPLSKSMIDALTGQSTPMPAPSPPLRPNPPSVPPPAVGAKVVRAPPPARGKGPSVPVPVKTPQRPDTVPVAPRRAQTEPGPGTDPHARPLGMRTPPPELTNRPSQPTMAHAIPPMPTVENTPPPSILPAQRRAATEADDRLETAMRETDYHTAVEVDAPAKAAARNSLARRGPDGAKPADAGERGQTEVDPQASAASARRGETEVSVGDVTDTGVHIASSPTIHGGADRSLSSSQLGVGPARQRSPASLHLGRAATEDPFLGHAHESAAEAGPPSDEHAAQRPVTFELAAQTVLSPAGAEDILAPARPATFEIAAQTVLSPASAEDIALARSVTFEPAAPRSPGAAAVLEPQSMRIGSLTAELAAQRMTDQVAAQSAPITDEIGVQRMSDVMAAQLDVGDVTGKSNLDPELMHTFARDPGHTPIPTHGPRTGARMSTAPTNLAPPRATDVAAAGPTPACPQCESPMAWVDEHLRFYCKQCRMYF